MSTADPGTLAASARALSLSGRAHTELHDHIFPGDGLEAAAILLCSRTPGQRTRFLVRHLLMIPHGACTRARDSIVWPGEWLEQAIDIAERERLSIILVHSHPGGHAGFSRVDNKSDQVVVPCLFAAVPGPHGSAVMTPDGAIVARVYSEDLAVLNLGLVIVTGDVILPFWAGRPSTARPIAFTQGMTNELGKLTAVIVGASGTGSIIVEQAARLGFGRIVAIDFDIMKHKNLNRIVNAERRHANEGWYKVDVMAEAVTAMRGEAVLTPVSKTIGTREAVLAASDGDILFSCVDTFEGRQFCDLIAAAFLMPLVDVGVTIPVRSISGEVAIGDVCGRIDYVQPGGSSLLDREVWTPAKLRAEYLRNASGDAHRAEVEAGYIRGMAEEAPSVITLNMRAASTAMNEFVARAYPFRHDANNNYARTNFSLAACEEEYFAEGTFATAANPNLARGSDEPLLGLPMLKIRRNR